MLVGPNGQKLAKNSIETFVIATVDKFLLGSAFDHWKWKFCLENGLKKFVKLQCIGLFFGGFYQFETTVCCGIEWPA